MVLTYLVALTHKLLGRGGMKALIAENLLLKPQLLLVTRSRKRASHLSLLDRFLLGLWTICLNPRRLLPARARRWTLMAVLHWPHKRQSVEHRFFSVCVSSI